MSATAPANQAPAFLAAAAGIAIYSCMDAIMKGLSIESGAYSAVLWRSVAGVAITGTLFVTARRERPGRAALRLHAQRGGAAGASVLLFFWGLARVPMAKSVALTFLAPILAIFLAAALLGERVRRAAVLGAVVASGGVLAIAAGEVRADASTDSVLGTVAIVVASILYAWSLILLRRQAQAADPLEVTLFTSLVIATAMLVGAPFLATWPSETQLLPIGAAACLGTVSGLLVAWAYRRAEAQMLAMVEYTAFVWAAILGFLVFGERVGGFTMIGAGLIVAGCIVAVRRAGPVAASEAGA